MSEKINQSTMKKTQTKGTSAMANKGNFDKAESSDSDGSVSDFKSKPSMKVTLKKAGNVQRGHFGQLKEGNPGVAVSNFNNKLVNYTNRKEATRLWWEQTDAWADRWDGPDSGDEGDAAWANVHLPKTHWKKREALQKKLEEEALEEEESDKGRKTKKRKM